ncbi:hypothetical protein KAW55_07735 [bacterium]|nr:hypothetical protein [bacterium]
MSKRKDSKIAEEEAEILALYSEALLSGKKLSIDEYIKNFKGDKKELTELLNLINLLHGTFK